MPMECYILTLTPEIVAAEFNLVSMLDSNKPWEKLSSAIETNVYGYIVLVF